MKFKKRKLFFIATLIFTICLTSGVSAKVEDDISKVNPNSGLSVASVDYINIGNSLSIKGDANTTFEAKYLWYETDSDGRKVVVLLIKNYFNPNGINVSDFNNFSMKWEQKSNLYNNFIKKKVSLCNASGVCNNFAVNSYVVPIDYQIYYRLRQTSYFQNEHYYTYTYIQGTDDSKSLGLAFGSNINSYVSLEQISDSNFTFDGIARMYVYQEKEETTSNTTPQTIECSTNEKMENGTCVCESGYSKQNGTGPCVKNNVQNTIDDALAQSNKDINKKDTTIDDNGAVKDAKGNQLYDKDGNALYIKPSNIKQEQVKVEDTGISSYIGYILGFIVLAIGSVVVYISLKKHKKAKQM